MAVVMIDMKGILFKMCKNHTYVLVFTITLSVKSFPHLLQIIVFMLISWLSSCQKTGEKYLAVPLQTVRNNNSN